MSKPDASEFLPPPFYPEENRPGPIDLEDAATALFLEKGVIPAAAARLRVTAAKFQRTIRKSPSLMRLITRLAEPDSK